MQHARYSYRSPRLLRFSLLVLLILLGIPALAQTARASSLTADSFGISTGGAIQNESQEDLNRELDVMANAGTKWIRVDINWAQVQSRGPQSYDWQAIDRVVTSASDRGIEVLGVIVYTPEWARPAGTPATHGPDPATYAKFAREAAAHYSAMGVEAFEIWNEPNTQAFWTPQPDIGAYTKLLIAAHDAIKAASPSAIVLSGGTAPAPSDGRNFRPVDFLSGIYSHGGAGSFDAVSHHPYCWPAQPGDREAWSAWHQMAGTRTSLRSLMTDNGDAAKQIWATEFGAPTNGPAGSHVSEQEQAEMITNAYATWGSYDWGGPLFTYQARDQGSSADTRENFFGLIREDWSEKPALAAYAAAAAGASDPVGGSGIPSQAEKPSSPRPSTPTSTQIAVERPGQGPGSRPSQGPASRPKPVAWVGGKVVPKSKQQPQLRGRVKLRLQRRIQARKWRTVTRSRSARVNRRGQFKIRIRKLRRKGLRPGKYRVRARYMGHGSVKPSSSRYRKFKLRRR